MSNQQFSNHTKYYIPHHVFFYSFVMILMSIGIRGMIIHPHRQWLWGSITALAFGIGWLSFMLRQHYALICQDRIVRLELRFRYFVLTGKRLEPIETQLSFKQLAALRFAPDEELEPLLQRALKENLSPNQIKKSIINWLPDEMRV